MAEAVATQDTITILLVNMRDMMTTICEYEKMTRDQDVIKENYTIISAKRILSETIQELNIVTQTLAASYSAEAILSHPMIANLREWFKSSAQMTHIAIFSQLKNFDILGISLVELICEGAEPEPHDYNIETDTSFHLHYMTFMTFSTIYDAYQHKINVSTQNQRPPLYLIN